VSDTDVFFQLKDIFPNQFKFFLLEHATQNKILKNSPTQKISGKSPKIKKIQPQPKISAQKKIAKKPPK